MSKKQRPIQMTPQEDAQSVGFIALMVGFGITYLGAEITLFSQPHPGHWLVAGVVAVIAGVLGYGLTLWRFKRR